jgi:hypothetical protein
VWLFGIVWFSSIKDLKAIEQADRTSAKVMSSFLPSISKNTAADKPFKPKTDEAVTNNQQTAAISKVVALPSVPSKSPEQKVKQLVKTNAQYIRQVLRNLNALDTKAIQFYFPQNHRKKTEIVQHMYHCEGVLFGAVDKKTQSQLTILSTQQNSQEPRSKLLRVVNQELSRYEQQLLRLYAAQDTPVRVFPYSLDYNLASLIANELFNHHDAGELHQFSAIYALVNGQLKLSNIEVNGRRLDTSWLLSVRPCIS